MPGKIFISYRRDDEPGYTQALRLSLENNFVAADIFMDLEGPINPGDDFVAVIRGEVATCEVLLAIIGRRWAELLAARMDDPDDFVVVEIAEALNQGKRIIPVLLGSAAMPRADALPPRIRALAHRSAVRLSPERFKADCQGLIVTLKGHLGSAEFERSAPTNATQTAAEVERQGRDAEQAKRIAAVEEKARLPAVSSLSLDEMRKAEEAANWNLVKDLDQPHALRDHSARFPGSVTGLEARARLEDLTWAGLGLAPDLAALQSFLNEFPNGAHADYARAAIADLESRAAVSRAAEQRRRQETDEWAGVSAARNPREIEAFLKRWPEGQHEAAARARVTELRERDKDLLRATLLGAAVIGSLVLAVAVGWWGYELWRWRSALQDTSLNVIDRSTAQSLLPGTIFKECETCPEMVVLPTGSFILGSTEYGSEQPSRLVTVRRPIAVAKFEVTFDEWDACVIAGACRGFRPGDENWGRGRRPVINVNWDDAGHYVRWLSAKTGEIYRLLSEAEWEFAARADTTTRYFWGNVIGKGNANCDGCGSQWDNKQTAPVGSFKPNAFGLHDMHGNVWEWVEDIHHSDHQGAPVDGVARRDTRWLPLDPISYRVMRGGSWWNSAGWLRSASRSSSSSTRRANHIGIRVARAL